MTGYCETHGRKFIGEGCPWCSNAGPVANGEPRVANTTPTAIDVANAVANSAMTYRYRAAEKRRCDLMRRRRTSGLSRSRA
jgi:hypothetical protein